MLRTLFVLSLLACLLSACNVVVFTPTPRGSSTGTPSVTERANITATASITETPGVTGTLSVTETPSATETMTGTATSAVTLTPMMTETATAVETPRATLTFTITSTMSDTNTMSGTTARKTNGLTASAQLQNTAGNRVGTATFTENSDGSVSIQVVVSGFTAAIAGQHGIHIHQIGKCTPDFQAAGGHFNPMGKNHGLSNPSGPHAGDLPNMVIDSNGNASYSATDHNITLSPGPNSLFDADGSALVIHADADNQATNPSGNSGGRIACGVITGGQQ